MVKTFGLRFLFVVNFSSSHSIKKQCWLALSLFLFTFSLVHPFPGLLLTFKCVDRLQGLTYASVPSMPLFHPYKLTLLMEKLGGFLGSL